MYTRQYVLQIAILLPIFLTLVYIFLFKVLPDLVNIYTELKEEQKEELNSEYKELLQDLEIAQQNMSNASHEYIDAACFKYLAAQIKLDKFIKETKYRQCG